MSNEDCDLLPPTALKADVPYAHGSSSANGSASNPAPPLSKLMALRDALVALKGPLSNEPGFRQVIESVLLNNEVHERVLGKRVREAEPRQPAATPATAP
ncbi:type VI secretion system contractile sheath small subunit [Pseudomonas gingeri]|uniref:Type VI secretion system contractile sheath small subunit n=1 Tax=Pseudomonas gingeri TaxID=117681 RepID=A0A7Y8C2J5_9PSED|nr:type VI secretion system contractile sheath small subunit [Pseudomonas gingeri]NWB96392.1 type VI secretion system contractile sheath small subunit [Pseudomonas gingeri]NWD71849.1 type VI secretion system contractile sheath small subunit [Pseudomonas gingeri]NWD77754.1 type VI secretion system contractile sheath small subunit [Pseudomonas gingeri]